eukprot:gene21470-27505_t
MARSSSRAPSRPAPKPAARAPPPAAAQRAPAPAPAAAPPAMAPQQSGGGGMLAGLGATMAQGFAFGTGSALAREAVGSFMGGNKEKAEAPPAPAAPVQQHYGAPSSSGPCSIDQQAFLACLNNNTTNAGNCDHYYNALQACQSRQ